MSTKFANGTISSVSVSTATKMFLGRAEATGAYPGTIIDATLSTIGAQTLPKLVCGCN